MVPVKNTRYVAKYSHIRKETKLADVKKHFIDISSMSSSAIEKFNPEGYTISCKLQKYSDVRYYFAKSRTIVMTNTDVGGFSSNLQHFSVSIAETLNIQIENAYLAMDNFFSNKLVIIKPRGIPVKFYEIGRYA